MKKYLSILLLSILLLSCKSDDTPFSIDLHNGIFVTNEGPFQNGTGTITFISYSGKVTQEVYKKVNNEDLGNIVQSMYLHNDKAYVVVNNSHKIVVANRYSMEKIAVISDFIENPRYFIAKNNVGYVSNWGNPQDTTDDYIAVINLTDYSLITKINVGEGPEKMLISNNKLYVNLQGGYGFNNKVSIVNLDTNSVENSIVVGDVPVGIVKDATNAIWVLCQGIPSYAQNVPETAGKLIKITNNQITEEYVFDAITVHPKNLTFTNNTLYYTINNEVFAFVISENTLPQTPLTGLQGNFYSLKANENYLFATDALNYNTEGKLIEFDLLNNNISNQYTTGIIPGNIVFQN